MSPYPKGSCVPLQPISLVEQPSLQHCLGELSYLRESLSSTPPLTLVTEATKLTMTRASALTAKGSSLA